MEDEKVTWGETFPMTVEVDDPLVVSATLTVSREDKTVVVTQTSVFFEGVADVSLTPTQTQLEPADYFYQLRVDYSDGRVQKYPNKDECEGEECGFPILTICEALDMG